MHELTITQSILDISLQAAQAQHARRIRAIRLTMGPFSGVVPECVQMYLDVLAKGLRVHCRACGRDSEIDRRRIACPFCGGVDLQRLSGREFLVDSLEVDV